MSILWKTNVLSSILSFLNSNERDWAQLDSLTGHLLEEFTNESKADEDENFINCISDEDDDFKFHQNTYATVFYEWHYLPTHHVSARFGN